MRIVLVNTDYPAFTDWLYAEQPGLEEASYDEQQRARAASLFGVADFYSRNLHAIGHDAVDLYPDNAAMQAAWVREHAPALSGAATRRRVVAAARKVVQQSPLAFARPLLRPLGRRLMAADSALVAVLQRQVRELQPDVVINQAMDALPAAAFAELRDDVGLVVGQIASPLPGGDYSAYDLVLSSAPNIVERFVRAGIPAQLQRLAFESSILEEIVPRERDIPVSFVGSLSPAHADRIEWLERLAEELDDLHVWAHDVDLLPRDLAIRRRYQGRVWGREMYEVLARSRITLNRHAAILGPYANNMRLFEATGMGALLVTDQKPNLADMFDPTREVVTYDSDAAAAGIVERLLDDPAAAAEVACAGQARTLGGHTYRRRAAELVSILEELL